MEEKKCTKCGTVKPYSEFYFIRGKPIGQCKECYRKRVKNYYENNKEVIHKKQKIWAVGYRQRAKRTKQGWYTKIYGAMKERNLEKFSLDLPFTKEEFIQWINDNYKEKFEKLFQEYVDSDCDKYLCPSIDRIDDYKSYTFDNMQLLTWRENDIKGTNGIKNKVSCAEVGKKYCSKTVVQFDENMNEIMRFSSTHEVGRILGFDPSSIAKACRKHWKSKGFYWRYEEDLR